MHDLTDTHSTWLDDKMPEKIKTTFAQCDTLVVQVTSLTLEIDHWMTAMLLTWYYIQLHVWVHWMFSQQIHLVHMNEGLMHGQNITASMKLWPTCKRRSLNGQVRRVQRLNMRSEDELECCQTSRKNPRKTLKLNACQNFRGCCNSYNTFKIE